MASAFLLQGCAEEIVLPVVEPVETQRMDPFLLEFLRPHIAAAKASPQDPALRATLGLVYEANKAWGLARSAFDNAEALQPDKPEWSFHSALMAFQQGDSEEGERRIVDLCTRFPKFGPARARRGRMLSDEGDLEGALVEFQSVLPLEPGWVDGLVSVAELLVQLERAAEAMPMLDEAEQRYPKYKRIHYVRGQALLELGRYAEAEKELAAGEGGKRIALATSFSRLRESYLAGYEVQNGKAVNYIRGKQFPQAIAILERVLRQKPGDAAVSNNLSVAYRGLDRHADAVQLLEESSARNPEHFPTLVNLSGSYWALGDFDRALATANRGIELVPSNGRVHLSKARALISLKRPEEACLELQESVRLDSSQVVVFSALAETLMGLKRYAEAEVQLETVLQKVPDNYAALFNLVKCQVLLGRQSEATESYRKLKTIAPNRPEVEKLGKAFGL